MAGVNQGNIEYFDGDSPDGGFLVIGTSGTSANQGSAIIHLTSVNFDFTNNTTDLQSFDSNFVVSRAITSQTFEVQAEGYFTEVQDSNYSGHSTYVTGQYNGAEILPLAVSRRSDLKIVAKFGSKIIRGSAIISSFSISSSVGEVITYSLTLSGNGAVTIVA